MTPHRKEQSTPLYKSHRFKRQGQANKIESPKKLHTKDNMLNSRSKHCANIKISYIYVTINPIKALRSMVETTVCFEHLPQRNGFKYIHFQPMKTSESVIWQDFYHSYQTEEFRY